MRLSPPRLPAAGWLIAVGTALLTLALALPAYAATAADRESLPIPEGSSTPSTLSGGAGGTLLRLGLGLIVVIGLIGLIWYVMKRVRRARYPALDERGPSLIDVVATSSLGPNRALHLVRIGEEIVLVGATDQSVNAIVRIGADEAASLIDPPPFGRAFAGAGVPPGDDRARAVATAQAPEGTLVERLRAMTTRR